MSYLINLFKVLLKVSINPKNLSSLTVVYDIETYNPDGAAPYSICEIRLSNFSGKNNRDITQPEFD